MLRIHCATCASGVKKYFEPDFADAKTGYYLDGSSSDAPVWKGEMAKEFGIEGSVTKEQFHNLCDGKHPETGESFVKRQNAERRVGYDFNFNAPKSVSLAYAVNQDERIMQAFKEAVGETMLEIEKDARSRQRAGGMNGDKVTGKLIWAEMTHTTARPVNGVSDAHLHAHCFAFNVTADFFALQAGEIKRAALYYQAQFHSLLAEKMQEIGYATERGKLSFELSGVSRKLIDKFSQRKQEAEKSADAKGLIGAKQRSDEAAKTRSAKDKDQHLTPDELNQQTTSRMSAEEIAEIKALKKDCPQKSNTPTTAKEAVEHALAHNLERQSVVEEKRLIADALHHGVGNVTEKEIRVALAERKDLLTHAEPRLDGTETVRYTTKETLKTEKELVEWAQKTRGTCAPLKENPAPELAKTNLNDLQKGGAYHILTSQDRVIMVQGVAGAGKTYMMKEVEKLVGKEKIHAFAPSSEASRQMLRKEGFENAETVAQLIQSKELQEKVKNGVIWIDEAGTVGAKDMAALKTIANRQNARLLLTGDENQHKPVAAGDAMRLLKEYGGLSVYQMNRIQRQQTAEYRKIVEQLRDGESGKALAALDKLGWVKEAGGLEDRVGNLAKDYVRESKEVDAKGKPIEIIVVTPTNAERNLVNERIRTELKKDGQLEGKTVRAARLTNLQWTDAERRTATNYEKGDKIVFNRDSKGFQRNETYTVAEKDGQTNQLILTNAKGEKRTLDLQTDKSFQTYRQDAVELAAGDKVRITANAKDLNGRKLHNGSVSTVKAIDPKGNLLLANGAALKPDFGHLTYGYASTSHAAQGKTADKVYLVALGDSAQKISNETLYVGFSRGKQSATLYTDDKTVFDGLKPRSEERTAALDLFGQKKTPTNEPAPKQKTTFLTPSSVRKPETPRMASPRENESASSPHAPIFGRPSLTKGIGLAAGGLGQLPGAFKSGFGLIRGIFAAMMQPKEEAVKQEQESQPTFDWMRRLDRDNTKQTNAERIAEANRARRNRGIEMEMER